MSSYWARHPGAMEASKPKANRTPDTSPGNSPLQGLSPYGSPATLPLESPPHGPVDHHPVLEDAHQVLTPMRRVCTVHDAASQAAMIYGGSTTTDVCDTLEFSGHSSAVVIGDDGVVRGVLTENDILKAYSDEAPWDYDADLWLQSGEARMPGFLLPVLTVEPSLPVLDAAAKMAVQRLGDYACHHLLVGGGTLGHYQILSALDVAMALCNGDLGEDVLGHGSTVADVMKLRGAVPEVKGTDCLKGAFDHLLASGQNCAVVVDEDGGFVYGAITPRDALRAFVEHVPEGTAVSGWLRGLGASPDSRRADASAPLAEAARLMVTNTLHHLLVTEPGTVQVVGVVSCLDIVCRIGARRLGESPAGLKVHVR